jgi:hypothetical protein
MTNWLPCVVDSLLGVDYAGDYEALVKVEGEFGFPYVDKESRNRGVESGRDYGGKDRRVITVHAADRGSQSPARNVARRHDRLRVNNSTRCVSSLASIGQHELDERGRRMSVMTVRHVEHGHPRAE